MLFGVPEVKDEEATGAWAEDGIVQIALRALRPRFPDLVLLTDVCLCEYTSHGHCGVVVDGDVDNDQSLELLARTAVSHAEAGADVVAPSDMMDGRVGAIREALDDHGLETTPILAYSAKYASAFYGPFREAADSAPSFGDRRGYQMDPANVREALRECEIDLEEGADAIMIKPALPYLDVIRAAREAFDVPLAAYNVSGEYAMVKAAARAGWLDERAAALESLTAIKRAGADLIVSYWTSSSRVAGSSGHRVSAAATSRLLAPLSAGSAGYASSVAPIEHRYRRSLRPCLARFSRGGARSGTDDPDRAFGALSACARADPRRRELARAAMRAVGLDEPLFVRSGDGAYVETEDGRRLLDWVMSWGPLLFGHADPETLDAVRDAASRGTTFGAATEAEVELAAEIADAVPSVEKVRLVSSGTEAAMSALRLARAFTKRDRILKTAGGYHGHADALLASAGSGLATLGDPRLARRARQEPPPTRSSSPTTTSTPWRRR